MTLQDKLALGLEHGIGVVEYGLCDTYADLVRTWRDAREIPSEGQILAWFDERSPFVDRSSLVIHAAQLREMLTRRGIRAQVEGAIAASGDQILSDWYEYAPTIRRDSPKVEALREALKISESDLDEWFRVAMTYE
jgi:hypothetical protein